MSVNIPGSPAPASWRRLLLLPSAAFLGAQAPRDRRVGWDQFWGEVQHTGDGGDVLWDTSNPGEMAQYLPVVLEHLSADLPIVDIGCGNGRQSRILAEHYPEVLGVDLSPIAIKRASQESAGVTNLRFQAVDLTTPDAGDQLVAAVGEANVFVRGVFHVLSPRARVQMVAAIRQVLGERGRLFLAETNYPGDALGYLRHLGARPGWIPMPLQRAIQRLPKPRHFGSTQRAACLPADKWTLQTEGVTQIYTIPLQHEQGSEFIPGYYAVVAARLTEPPA